jgi:hypothetical protein
MSRSDFDVITGPSMSQQRVPSTQQPSGASDVRPAVPVQPATPTEPAAGAEQKQG